MLVCKIDLVLIRFLNFVRKLLLFKRSKSFEMNGIIVEIHESQLFQSKNRSQDNNVEQIADLDITIAENDSNGEQSKSSIKIQQNPDEISSSITLSSEATASEMFALNVDCFDEIFEYLSLKDLYAFGCTCKTLQQTTGEYFQRNYKSAEKFSRKNGIYTVYVYSDNEGVKSERTQTAGFNRFINFISCYYENHEPLRYIDLHAEEFTSINHIYLVCLELNAAKIWYLRKILSRLETVQLRQCTMHGDFYEMFLKFCGNLKRIYIQDDLGDILDENGNPWLHQNYPTLEFLQLKPRYSFKINELSAFFERNVNIRYFSTSLRCLWENRDKLLNCEAELDSLEILILDKYHRHMIRMHSAYSLLNQLFDRGFYKRLHLHVKRIDETCSEQLISLHGLETLSIVQFSGFDGLTQLIELKELNVDGSVKSKDIEILAMSLVNLECLSIGNINCNDLLPFIRYTEKLKKIRANNSEGEMDLVTFNKERNKLCGARKVTIYVPDNCFLATKWSIDNGNTNLSLVEMKRLTSHF